MFILGNKKKSTHWSNLSLQQIGKENQIKSYDVEESII